MSTFWFLLGSGPSLRAPGQRLKYKICCWIYTENILTTVTHQVQLISTFAKSCFSSDCITVQKMLPEPQTLYSPYPVLHKAQLRTLSWNQRKYPPQQAAAGCSKSGLVRMGYFGSPHPPPPCVLCYWPLLWASIYHPEDWLTSQEWTQTPSPNQMPGEEAGEKYIGKPDMCRVWRGRIVHAYWHTADLEIVSGTLYLCRCKMSMNHYQIIIQTVRTKGQTERELNFLYLHYRALNQKAYGEHPFIKMGASLDHRLLHWTDWITCKTIISQNIIFNKILASNNWKFIYTKALRVTS